MVGQSILHACLITQFRGRHVADQRHRKNAVRGVAGSRPTTESTMNILGGLDHRLAGQYALHHGFENDASINNLVLVLACITAQQIRSVEAAAWQKTLHLQQRHPCRFAVLIAICQCQRRIGGSPVPQTRFILQVY